MVTSTVRSKSLLGRSSLWLGEFGNFGTYIILYETVEKGVRSRVYTKTGPLLCASHPEAQNLQVR